MSVAISSARSGRRGKLRRNAVFFVLAAPALVHTVIFQYLPMIGVVLAFKDYRYDKGIFGSDWAGLKNFEFFFTSQDAWRVTRNTVGLNFIFIVVGLVVSVAIALLFFEVRRRGVLKFYQTAVILPNFLSFVVIAYMTYALFNPAFGIANRLLEAVGLSGVRWYSEPVYWPFILTFVNTWKYAGMGSIVYYAGLVAIDQELYEAAIVDGASKWQQTWRISIPSLVPLMTVLNILALGRIFRADFGLFYQIPRDSGLLYPATDVIDTYVFRALKEFQDIGMSSAVGLYQAIVGFALVITANWVVNRIEPDNALY